MENVVDVVGVLGFGDALEFGSFLCLFLFLLLEIGLAEVLLCGSLSGSVLLFSVFSAFLEDLVPFNLFPRSPFAFASRSALLSLVLGKIMYLVLSHT